MNARMLLPLLAFCFACGAPPPADPLPEDVLHAAPESGPATYHGRAVCEDHISGIIRSSRH